MFSVTHLFITNGSGKIWDTRFSSGERLVCCCSLGHLCTFVSGIHLRSLSKDQRRVVGKMKVRIETTPAGFVIKSSDALMNLRSEYEGQTIQWPLVEQGDLFTYALTTEELVTFFDGSKPVTASLVFDEADKQKEVSVDDMDIEFGSKLDIKADNNVITAYVSLKSTMRIGWNWVGATAAITKGHTITGYEMTPAGLRISTIVETKFFKPTALDLAVVGTFLKKPLTYVSTDIETVENDSVFENKIDILIPMADVLAMRCNVEKHGLGQKTFEFKFKLQIAEYRLTKDTIKWQVAKELVLANPLLEVSSNEDEDFVLATRVTKPGNLMFIPAAVGSKSFTGIRQQLLDATLASNPTKTVLLDQGAEFERQNMRLLFKAMRKAGMTDVYLLTDGQNSDSLPVSDEDYVIFAHSKEHVWVYPQIKTLICMGNRHDAFPLGAQAMLPVIVKHHVILMDNLLAQKNELGFNFPANGTVDFMVASKQMNDLVKRVFTTRAVTHMTGLPAYDAYEEQYPTTDAKNIGLLLKNTSDTDAAKLLAADNVVEMTESDNARQFEVVISDDYAAVMRASSVGVPVVYLNAELTADTVDHYYRLAGPVIRDIKTGAPILERVLSGAFDFSTDVQHAEDNLNGFHDTASVQRILEVLHRQ